MERNKKKHRKKEEMAERPVFVPLAWDTETKKLEMIQTGEAETETLTAYKEARQRMGHIRRKINVINDELEEASKNAQKEIEQLSFTGLSFEDLMHTIKTKTEELHAKKKEIAAEVLSVTNRLEKDLVVEDTPDNDEGESALDIYCRNAEKVKKQWHGKVQGIITKMNKNQIYFSKNITVINRK